MCVLVGPVQGVLHIYEGGGEGTPSKNILCAIETFSWKLSISCARVNWKKNENKYVCLDDAVDVKKCLKQIELAI